MADVTEEVSKESLVEANQLLTGIHKPQPPEANQAPQTQGGPPPNGGATDSRKQRTTVAKLAQRYQGREAELLKEITEIENIISGYQTRLVESKFKLSVWREALAEIEQD